MKKLLRFTRLMVCLCAVLSSTTAFAGADWVGGCAINVNGTWYRADDNGANSWAGTFFSSTNLGSITSLELGGQLQLHDGNAQWANTSTAKMLYKFDDNTIFNELTLNWYKYENTNNFFQSGGDPTNDKTFTSATIDITGLSLGTHSLTVKFVDIDGLKPTAEFTANFTKVADISTAATVTGVEASYNWTDTEIHPIPVVTLGGNELSSTNDYDVTYSDGCQYAGNYSVTITGKGNYTGTIVKPFTINSGYYLVGTMNNWKPSESYKLVENTLTDGEYYINDVQLAKDVEFKVRSAAGDYYPGGSSGNFGVPATTTYNIYFQPNGNDGRDGWYYGKIYSVVTLNETDNSTLLNDLNGKKVNVILNRTLKAGGWNSFCAPFGFNIPSGWTVKELSSANLESGALTLYFTNSNTITAGKPYLVNVSSDVAPQTYTDVTINKNPDPKDINGIVSFIPVMSPTQLEANDKTVLFIKDGNKLTYPSSDSNINGFRAYFKQPTNSNARVFNMSFDDDATGISFVLSDEAKTDNGIYMLDGRRVQGQPTQKGVYIVNGKKRIIK